MDLWIPRKIHRIADALNELQIAKNTEKRPLVVREPAPCLRPKQECQDISLASILSIEPTQTWSSLLLDLAGEKFDSVPIYYSVPCSFPEESQVNLNVGLVQVTARGPTHSIACEEAAKKAFHILKNYGMPTAKSHMVDDSLVNEETTGNHIKIAPKVPEGQLIYTSSPTLILESIATILSKPLAYSRLRESGALSKTIRVICIFGDWHTCGQGLIEELAKMEAGKSMLTVFHENNAFGINWPAAVKMLDKKISTNLKRKSKPVNQPQVFQHLAIQPQVFQPPVMQTLNDPSECPVQRIFEFQDRRQEPYPVFEVVSFCCSKHHVKQFVVKVTVGSLIELGMGTSLKEAKIAASQTALETLIAAGAHV